MLLAGVVFVPDTVSVKVSAKFFGAAPEKARAQQESQPVELKFAYLLRKRLPFSFEATIIAAAIALSLLSIVFAYRLIKPDKK